MKTATVRSTRAAAAVMTAKHALAAPPAAQVKSAVSTAPLWAVMPPALALRSVVTPRRPLMKIVMEH
jgi:hypothetical protein